MPNCTSCGREVQDWEETYYDSFQVCSDCYRRKFGAGGKALLCTGCAKRIGESEANRSLGTTLCKDCYEKEMKRRAEWVCSSCKRNIHLDERKFRSPDGKVFCKECMEKNSARPSSISAWGKCSACGKKTPEGRLVGEGEILCPDCYADYFKERGKMGEKEGTKEGIAGRLKSLFKK